MSKNEKILTAGVVKKSPLEKLKEKAERVWREVKWFFYNISSGIHAFFRKKLGTRQKSMKSGNRSAFIFAHLLVLYPFLQFLIFYVVVNFNSVILSLQTYDLMKSKFFFADDLFINFKNVFRDLFTDTNMIYCVRNSFISYGVGLVIGFPLNLTFAYVIYKKVPCSGFFQIVLFLPQILSSIVMSMMFELFIRDAVPFVLEKWFGLHDVFLLGEHKAFGTMLFYSLWAGFGSALILYSGAMSRIPDSIIEYGELEGISLWAEFWYVCLPMIFSTITIFLVTGVAGIFSNQLALYNFYGADAFPVARTLGYHFFILVLGENPDYVKYPYASAAGLVFSLVATPVTLLARYLLEKYGPNVEF